MADTIMQKLLTNLPADPIFFKKEDITVGRTLLYYGLSDPMGEWEVKKIISWFTTDERGKWEPREVPEVRHLDDDVYIVKIGNSRIRRKFTFGYIRYSAIWRLG
jgi:hypothetical protein